MDTPLAFCLTPTFGRFHLLQEMVWCWTRQTYPNKQLLIVNDQPNLTIECEIPGVTVHNIPERFPALGAKRNYMRKQIPEEAEFIFPMDDDDVFFEDHIERLVGAALKNPQYVRVKNLVNYMSKDNRYTGAVTSWEFYGASCFQASAYRQFWMQEAYVWGEDSDMLRRHKVTTYNIPLPDSSFIYRQGMGIVHASGHGLVHSDMLHQKEVHERIAAGTPVLDTPTKLVLTPSITSSTMSLITEIRKMRN